MTIPAKRLRLLAIRPLQAMLLLLSALAGGCRPIPDGSPGTSPPAKQEDSAAVMIDSVNYMHEKGMQYTLYDLSRSPPLAVGGAIADRLATGGEKGCCLALPRHWRSGMKVRLEWEESDRERTYEKNTRDLEIPPYEEPADLYVVFHPNKEVELVVSDAEPGHPDWRGRIKQTPWDHCVENHGRKPCKAALPKLFDTGSYQGYCPTALAEKRPRAESNCEFLMERCMNDFENEDFCKNVLWGVREK